MSKFNAVINHTIQCILCGDYCGYSTKTQPMSC